MTRCCGLGGTFGEDAEEVHRVSYFPETNDFVVDRVAAAPFLDSGPDADEVSSPDWPLEAVVEEVGVFGRQLGHFARGPTIEHRIGERGEQGEGDGSGFVRDRYISHVPKCGHLVGEAT